jgi:hypothetical protein
MQLTCPVCGQSFSPADLNLIGMFELYLFLVFVLSSAIRFHHYRSNVAFVLQVPQRWPQMYSMIREHTGLFLRWTMIVPVSIALAVFLFYLLAYRLVWTEAVISWQELWADPLTAVQVTAVGCAMLALDLSALFGSSQWDYSSIEQNLTRGESALNSRSLKILRFLTFKRIDHEQIVRARVKGSLGYARLALIDQLRRQSVHTAVRIACGFLLWIAWYRIGHRSATVFSVTSSLSVLIVLSAILIWLRIPLLNSPQDSASTGD